MGEFYAGIADLPLHEGHVPRWIAVRMRRLLKAILEVAVELHGPRWVVEMLADPLWFQALNNIIGMDWDSSGSTTVLTGLLRQVTWESSIGLMVAGGKGRRALETPRDLEVIGERLGLSTSRVEELKRLSRLAAAADSSLLQDGFQLYHHAVIVAEDGSWTIVQQGMSVEERMARRYHLSHRAMEKSEETLEPHTGVVSRLRRRLVLDLTSRRSVETRRVMVDVAREEPTRVLRLIREAVAVARGVAPLTTYMGGREPPRLAIRYYRPVKPPDVRRLEPVLKRVYEEQPRSIEELVLVRGVGPATLRALALVAELVYGAEASHEDPAVEEPLRYAFAVGGKDGYPYPFNPHVADELAAVLEEVVARAKAGDRRLLNALKQLRSMIRDA